MAEASLMIYPNRPRVSREIELSEVLEDEGAPVTTQVGDNEVQPLGGLPDDFRGYDEVRYIIAMPARATSYTVTCWRFSPTLGVWLEDPEAGGVFTASATVTQKVLGDRLAMTITGIVASAASDPPVYDDDYFRRTARAYLVGA